MRYNAHSLKPNHFILSLIFSCLVLGCTRPPALPQNSGSGGSGGGGDPRGPVTKSGTLLEGWESSGGGGVACFESEAAALEADVALAKSGALNDSLRAKIKTVVTLEMWENAKDWNFAALHSKSRDEILKHVRGLLAEHSPIFHSRLEMVENRIAYRTWEANAALPRVEDAQPKFAVKETDSKCRVVQLAVRYTKSKKGFLPEARVDVDQWLFENRLDALNQAMLILHEEIYLMGRELVHKNSDALRRTVAILFSDELAETTQKLVAREQAAKDAGVQLVDPNIPSHLINTQVNSILGDYYLYFNLDPMDKPAVVPSAPGQYSRHLAFGRMLVKSRDRKAKCLNDEKYDEKNAEEQAKIFEKCSFIALNPASLTPLLDDEEAFVFTSRWVLDRMRVTKNSEHLVVWNRKNPAAISDVQKTELENACVGIPTLKLPMFRRLLEKSARYCESIPKLKPS